MRKLCIIHATTLELVLSSFHSSMLVSGHTHEPEAIQQAALQSTMPHKEWWAAEWKE
jgi:predicted phosphodiesterase